MVHKKKRHPFWFRFKAFKVILLHPNSPEDGENTTRVQLGTFALGFSLFVDLMSVQILSI